MLAPPVRLTMVLAVCLAAVVTSPSCRRPQPPAPTNDNQQATEVNNNSDDQQALVTPPDRIRIDGPDPKDKDRWLFVDEIKEDAQGGWADGGFDVKRNKLTIETHDVAGFAVDFGKIPIDWDRLVVLRIDGFNSEFRRRKYPVVRFEVTPTGDWIVIERKKGSG